MTATELLCHLIGINPAKLSKEENIILEAELFVRICEELREVFREKYKEYFRVMKFDTKMEDEMLEANFLRCVVNDILTTEEYTLQGIASYTRMPEDVIYDVATGCNLSPSLPLSQKIIELHRSIRPNLYRQILKKITAEAL